MKSMPVIGNHRRVFDARDTFVQSRGVETVSHSLTEVYSLALTEVYNLALTEVDNLAYHIDQRAIIGPLFSF